MKDNIQIYLAMFVTVLVVYIWAFVIFFQKYYFLVLPIFAYLIFFFTRDFVLKRKDLLNKLRI